MDGERSEASIRWKRARQGQRTKGRMDGERSEASIRWKRARQGRRKEVV